MWDLFNPKSKQAALRDVLWGHLVWREGKWMYRRYRYPLWWRMWEWVHAGLISFGAWLQYADLRCPRGREYFESANLPAATEEYIAGMKNPNKTFAVKVCCLPKLAEDVKDVSE